MPTMIERLDGSLSNQGVGRFAYAPVHPGNERCGGIKKVLAVFEIENRELQVRAFFIDAGRVDDQVALFCEEAGGEFFVFVQLAGAGSGEFGGQLWSKGQMQFLRLRVRVKFSCVCDESAVTCASCDGMPVTRRLPRECVQLY